MAEPSSGSTRAAIVISAFKVTIWPPPPAWRARAAWNTSGETFTGTPRTPVRTDSGAVAAIRGAVEEENLWLACHWHWDIHGPIPAAIPADEGFHRQHRCDRGASTGRRPSCPGLGSAAGARRPDRSGGPGPPASDHRPAARQHGPHRARQLRRCLGARLRLFNPMRLGTGPRPSAAAGTKPPGLRAGSPGAAADAWPAQRHAAPGAEGGALQAHPAPAACHPRQVRHGHRRPGGCRRRLGPSPARRHRPVPAAAGPADPLGAGGAAEQPRVRLRAKPRVLRGPRLPHRRLRHLGAG